MILLVSTVPTWKSSWFYGQCSIFLLAFLLRIYMLVWICSLVSYVNIVRSESKDWHGGCLIPVAPRFGAMQRTSPLKLQYSNAEGGRTDDGRHTDNGKMFNKAAETIPNSKALGCGRGSFDSFAQCLFEKAKVQRFALLRTPTLSPC